MSAWLIVFAMALCSAALVTGLIGLCIGYASFNQCLATFDALLLCAYFAAEFGHGGGNPINRSGM
jgi:hypothetical protein